MTAAADVDPIVLRDSLVARCRFPKGRRALTCAVSGGADSLALLVLAVAAGFEVTAVHVDHGLREGSDREADSVAAAAEQFGAHFEARRVALPLRADGPNVEALAREARYAVLPDDVATGHTADDVAETILLNLIRGSGLNGLSPLVGPGPRYRPLVQLRRSETTALCAAYGLAALDDPMNHDPRFRRVRVRTEVIPLLDDIASRDIVPLLARLADTVVDDIAALDTLAAQLDPTSAAELAAAPRAVARRAIRRWLVDSGVGDGHPPSLAVVDRVLAVARGDTARADLVGGSRVARTSRRLRLERIGQPPPDASDD